MTALIIQEKGGGRVIASGEADRQVNLLEGNWYFDPGAVDFSVLTVTSRTYTCPYKGICYWIDLETEKGRVPNIAWVYRDPMLDYLFIKDQIGFYARSTSGTEAITRQGPPPVFASR